MVVARRQDMGRRGRTWDGPARSAGGGAGAQRLPTATSDKPRESRVTLPGSRCVNVPFPSAFRATPSQALERQGYILGRSTWPPTQANHRIPGTCPKPPLPAAARGPPRRPRRAAPIMVQLVDHSSIPSSAAGPGPSGVPSPPPSPPGSTPRSGRQGSSSSTTVASICGLQLEGGPARTRREMREAAARLTGDEAAAVIRCMAARAQSVEMGWQGSSILDA